MKLGTRFGLTGLRLALIDKPSPGTGATLLTEVVARIATGGESEIMSPVAHEEEARKQITATLILGRPIIILDNVGGELSTHALARALTSTTWSDRILGHSRMATLPQRAIWIATGNNLRIGGDLPRRCYRIFMDAKMSRPWEREAGEFKHPNLLEWAGENRGQLLSAALTICRNWFAAGKPKWSGRPLGTFEGWSTTVGGILEAAGIVGFLENSAEIYDQITDDGSDEWEEFLTAWLEVHGTKPLRIKDLVDSLKDNPSLLEALPVELAVAYAEGNRLLTRKFGDAFRQRDGIRYDSGLRLEKGKKDKKHKVHLWRAVSDDDPGSDCPGEGPGGRPDGPRRGRRGQRGQETPASDRRGSIVTGEYQSKLPASEVGVGDPADPAKVAPLSEKVATSNVHQFRKFTLVDGETSLRRCVEHVKTTDLVAADIETTGKDWWSDTIRVVSLTTVAGKTFVVDVAKVDPAPLYRVLEKKHLVFHHAAFDVPFLRRAGCNPSRVSCTMVLSQLLHAGREGVFHSLEEVAKRYTPDVADDVKAVAVDHEVWKAKELPEDALAYAASDTQSLLEVYRAELDALVEEGLGDVAELEERFLSVVVEVVDAGMPVDPERWSAVVDEVVERKLALSRQLDAMLGDVEVPEKFEKANRDKTAVDRINWSSPEQKVWAVEEALGLTVPTRWDYKKKVERKTLDKDHLHLLDHPVAEALREYQAIANFPATYARALLERFHDGRIFADWKQLEARTGRMSCCNPPLHNIPKKTKLREAIVAPEGHKIITLDFSQIEPRILAAISRDTALLRAFREGLDVYRFVAEKVTGIPMDEISPNLRAVFKTVVLGMIYGMSPVGLTLRIHRDIDPNMTAEKISDYFYGFFDAFPEAKRWREGLEDEFDRGSRETRTPLGRRRLDVENKRQRWNAPIQGAATDAFRAAAAELLERRDEVGGFRIIALIHDEVVLEVPEENADTVEEWAGKVMAEAAASVVNAKLPKKLHIETKVDAGAGATLQEAKDKAA